MLASFNAFMSMHSTNYYIIYWTLRTDERERLHFNHIFSEFALRILSDSFVLSVFKIYYLFSSCCCFWWWFLEQCTKHVLWTSLIFALFCDTQCSIQMMMLLYSAQKWDNILAFERIMCWCHFDFHSHWLCRRHHWQHFDFHWIF